MRTTQLVRYDLNLLLQRRPVITMADPAVRSHTLAELEIREAQLVWERSRRVFFFFAMVPGPHLQGLAREWRRPYGSEAGFQDIGLVGTTVVFRPGPAPGRHTSRREVSNLGSAP